MESVVDKVRCVLFLSLLRTCVDYWVKVIQVAIGELSKQIVEHALSDNISNELRALLVCSCHRVARARDVAMKYLNRLITSFPSLMCDKPLVFQILEILTMLRRACEGEFTDEVSSVLLDFRKD